MREASTQDDGGAGVDARRDAETVCGTVIERHACVHSVRGFEAEVFGCCVANEQFAAGSHYHAFWEAGGA